MRLGMLIDDLFVLIIMTNFRRVQEFLLLLLLCFGACASRDSFVIRFQILTYTYYIQPSKLK